MASRFNLSALNQQKPQSTSHKRCVHQIAAIPGRFKPEEEAVVVAFRRYTLLPLDDCLYGLQPTIPHLTRSSLHRCFQRHGIERLPDVEGNKTPKKKFKAYPIGYFHIDIAEVRTAEGKPHLFIAIDRTSNFA
jgi:hypothetical protein